jgi:DNA-binding GntR family transcriptional regulator
LSLRRRRAPMTMKLNQSHRNLKEAVYQRLKESIVRGKLSPGSKLVETQISQQLGVSRTPLREAINRLERDGFVEIFPRRGAFVKKHSLQEILENLELREVLEGLAGRLAARHAKPEILRKMKGCFLGFSPGNVERFIESYSHRNVRFHNLIVQACQNRKLISIIRNLYDQMDMVRLHTIALPGRARKSLAEHRAILQFVVKRQGDLAERHLRAHIRDLRRAVRKLPSTGFSRRPAGQDP